MTIDTPKTLRNSCLAVSPNPKLSIFYLDPHPILIKTSSKPHKYLNFSHPEMLLHQGGIRLTEANNKLSLVLAAGNLVVFQGAIIQKDPNLPVFVPLRLAVSHLRYCHTRN